MRYKSPHVLLITGLILGFQQLTVSAQTPKYSFNDLPDWICLGYPSANHLNYSIGVSDPGLSKKASYNQALIRGSALLEIQESFNFNKMSESFLAKINENDLAKRLYGIVSLSSSFDTSDVEVEDVYFSEFGECFLRLKKSPQEGQLDVKQFRAVASLFRTVDDMDASLKRGILKLDITDLSGYNYSYSKYFLNDQAEIASMIGDSTISVGSFTYKYKDCCEDRAEPGKFYISEKMSNSFWDGYFTAIIYSAVYQYNTEAKFSSMSEGSNSYNKSLNRSIVDINYTLSIQGLYVMDNKLYLSVKISEIK